MTGDTLVIIFVIIASVAAWFFIPNYMAKRAMRKVIMIFRDTNTVNAQNARRADELGITPQTFMQTLYMPRDYKPAALKMLIEADIIRETRDGRLYLEREKLNEYQISKEVK